MRARLIAFAFSLLIALPSAAAITGTVMNVDGQPVAGAKVSVLSLETVGAMRTRLLSKTPERTPIAAVQSDSKGAFKLDSPPDPVLQLRIEAKGYAPEFMNVERDEELGAIALVAAEARRGTITANGKPLAGATVIWLAGRNEAVATTDAEGHYSVPDPAKWAGRVIVAHPDYALLDENARGLAGGDAKRTLDWKLDAGAAISGRAVGADGQTPAAKATVLLDGWPAATTGDDGTFSIPHAPKKWELLEARSGNLSGQRARAGDGAIVVKMSKGASVSGSVRDAKAGLPIAGSEVTIARMGGFGFGGTPIDSAVVDAKGNYSIGPLTPGTYVVSPYRTGYSGNSVNVSLAAGQAAQKPLTATQEAKVIGSVVDEDRKPLAAVLVSPQTVSREGGMFMGPRMPRFGRTVFSGPDGRFSLRVNPDSDIQIEAVKKGLPAAKSSSMRLAAGERKSGVTITVPRGVAVSGTVTDKNGKPLSGVAVTASETEGGGGPGFVMRRAVAFAGITERDDTTMRTGSDGGFTIRLKEGTYDLYFKRQGFAPKTLRAQQVNAAVKPVAVSLEEGVEVTGRVTRGGAGVPDVNISVFSQDNQGFETTGPDGSFRIGDLLPGPMMLMVNKQSDFIQQMRPVTAPARDVTIDLPAGGTIRGRAVDKNTHQPVASFQAGISTSRQGGGMMIQTPPQLRSFTSDDGTFTLENVPAGPVEVVVQAPGYTTGRVSGLTLEEGKTLSDVEVALDTGVRLTGKVTGPDGAALSGVAVRQDTGGGPMRRVMRIGGGDGSAVTDANGEYTVEAIEPGEKTFEFSRSGYLPEQRTITLSGREARLDAQLTSGMRLTGIVTTEGGVPVADASVRAMSAASGGFGRSTQTDGGGSFQFEGLAPGHYTFSASKSGYAEGSVRDVDIASGAPVRITLKTGGTIYGHVVGLSESELAHASVSARGATGGAEAPVDATGNYRIEGAPTGTVRVQAEISRGFGENRSAPMKSVQVEPGGTAQVDLEFLSQTTIRGRVTRDGKPLANAMVSFFPRSAQSQTNSQTTTDANGAYTITGLQDAPYSVSVVDLQRLNPYSTSYEVKGSSTFDIDIRTTTVRGRVVDAGTGEALVDARVQIRKSGPNESPFATRGATTNSSGAFTMESISPGNYVATADKDGYGNAVRDIIVTDSGTEDLEFKLAPNSGVTLKVVDARDGRMLSATVTVYDAQNRVVYDEPFRFGGGAETIRLTLAPGTYQATIGAIGYAARSVSIVSPSNQTVQLSPGGTLVVRSSSSTAQRARLIDSNGQPYMRPMARNAVFLLDASPGTTTLQNIASGSYTLQVLDANDVVLKSSAVVVPEGGTATVDI